MNPVESTVGLLSEHPVAFIAAVTLTGGLVLAALLAVGVVRMIGLAEFEDLDVELRVVR